MNKIKFITLVVFVSLIGACYQKNSSSIPKTAQTSATSSPNSAPIIEKPVESNSQTSKTSDFSTALNYFNSKDYEKAASEFEELVKTDAKNQQAHFHLGKSYQALSKPEQAIGAYKKAIEIKPDYAEANYELGKIYFDKKDFQTSLPFIEKAAKIKYTSTDYLIALGDNYRELKKCDYAVVPYGKVTGFDDKNTAAYYGMGLCYVELKNRIAAGQQVRNLEKLDPNLAKKLAAQIPQ
jgi:tetratricopeptide (TPR) repeat protein